MKFYAGSSDEDSEPPYGVVIARDFEETVRGDHVYYGSLQVRVVHDIDDRDAAGHAKRMRETQLALKSLVTPTRDPVQQVRILGISPQKTQTQSGRQVYVDIIPVELGVEDLDAANDTTIERRTELAFADYLESGTAEN